MNDRRNAFDLAHYDWFWSVIEQVRDALESVEAVFQGMSEEQLVEFYNIYRVVSVELYPEYCDEERGWYEEDVSSASDWVVNQGKAFYHVIYNDLSLFPDPETVPFCNLSGWAATEYYKRFSREIREVNEQWSVERAEQDAVADRPRD